jgi:WD40 repeat protein
VFRSSRDIAIMLCVSWFTIGEKDAKYSWHTAIAINPKDTNTFASACLDRTVKIWSLGSATANFTLEAHEVKVSDYCFEAMRMCADDLCVGSQLG